MSSGKMSSTLTLEVINIGSLKVSVYTAFDSPDGVSDVCSVYIQKAEVMVAHDNVGTREYRIKTTTNPEDFPGYDSKNQYILLDRVVTKNSSNQVTSAVSFFDQMDDIQDANDFSGTYMFYNGSLLANPKVLLGTVDLVDETTALELVFTLQTRTDSNLDFVDVEETSDSGQYMFEFPPDSGINRTINTISVADSNEKLNGFGAVLYYSRDLDPVPSSITLGGINFKDHQLVSGSTEIPTGSDFALYVANNDEDLTDGLQVISKAPLTFEIKVNIIDLGLFPQADTSGGSGALKYRILRGLPTKFYGLLDWSAPKNILIHSIVPTGEQAIAVSSDKGLFDSFIYKGITYKVSLETKTFGSDRFIFVVLSVAPGYAAPKGEVKFDAIYICPSTQAKGEIIAL
jgi:hypothetical protein